ncbi:MAG TPA: hypothetical protein PLL20_11680 [Phycisphaerae bacterium]|nr:hypothetical protein [Phycisphaerae bacterium]
MAGGSPVVAGTKFPVRSLVQYVLKQGMSPEELVSPFRRDWCAFCAHVSGSQYAWVAARKKAVRLREFPQLSLPAVYDALSYYYDHQAELEAEMEDNTEACWREEM